MSSPVCLITGVGPAKGPGENLLKDLLMVDTKWQCLHAMPITLKS